MGKITVLRHPFLKLICPEFSFLLLTSYFSKKIAGKIGSALAKVLCSFNSVILVFLHALLQFLAR